MKEIDKIADRCVAEYRKAWIDIVPPSYREQVSQLLGTAFKGQWLAQTAVEAEADNSVHDAAQFRRLSREALRLYRHLLNDCVIYLKSGQ